MTYADVEIRIRGKTGAEYPVEITVQTATGRQEYMDGVLNPAGSPGVAAAGYADRQYGVNLFNWLFADPTLQKHWATISGEHKQRRIRLRLAREAPELHQYPWESLCEPDSAPSGPALRLAAAEATPLSRYLDGQWQPGKPVIGRPVRMLVAIANPDGLAALNPPLDPIVTSTEWEALNQALQGLQRTSVDLERLEEPCTLPRLSEALRTGHYHILHLICHGTASRGGPAVLYLADKDNRVARVTDEDLAEQLALLLANTQVDDERKLRLVFLASCQTARRSAYDSFRGVAPRLVAAGVPAVLAMQDNVGVVAAREFAKAFYERLLEHGQADLAANQARRWLLADAEAANRLQIAIPALFLRLQDGQLLGRRGVISSGRTQDFWPSLLGNLHDGFCTVFLGPHINAGLLPATAEVAERLTRYYRYPLQDTTNLSHVAQFADLRGRAEVRRRYVRELIQSLPRYLNLELSQAEKAALQQKKTFGQVVDDLNWVEKVRNIQENPPHLLLADLPIGLYIATTPDNLMHLALARKFAPIGLQADAETDPDRRRALKAQLPRREQPRWVQAGTALSEYALQPAPDKDHPVVFHLNGFDEDPRNLVLSEDDYLQHLVRLMHDQEKLLPSNVLGKLATDSLIFLGFHLDDWELRVILHGLMKRIAQSDEMRHVGVQLDPGGALDEAQAQRYLEDYLGTYRIDIYWGEARQFANELHSRWNRYQETGDVD
jgi:hypothetical protein